MMGPAITREDYEIHLLAHDPVAPFLSHAELQEAIKDSLESVMEGFPAVACAQLDMIGQRLACGPVPATKGTVA